MFSWARLPGALAGALLGTAALALADVEVIKGTVAMARYPAIAAEFGPSIPVEGESPAEADTGRDTSQSRATLLPLFVPR